MNILKTLWNRQTTNQKVDIINQKLDKVITRLGWIERIVNEIQDEQEKSKEREKYIIDAEVKIYSILKRTEEKEEEEREKALKEDKFPGGNIKF